MTPFALFQAQPLADGASGTTIPPDCALRIAKTARLHDALHAEWMPPKNGEALDRHISPSYVSLDSLTVLIGFISEEPKSEVNLR